MQTVSLITISKRLNRYSWRLLEILEVKSELAKKDLFEQTGETSRRKFDIEYAKLFGASLIEEKVNDLDGRSLYVSLTQEGKWILAIKNK